ncbi:MAG: sodium:proton antiporter [Candidatus Krumholzibacteriia bacterium]
MSVFDLAAIIITVTAVFGWVNTRFLRLPPSVGLLAISLASSLSLLAFHVLVPSAGLVPSVRAVVAQIDFNEALMHGMLAFLLFAGALHADLDVVMRRRGTIVLLATVGLLISTAVVGLLCRLVFGLLGLEVSWLACLIFGALISPTDPISVMAALKTLHAPASLEAKIAGESLFNDGVAVVVFTALVALLPGGTGAHAHHAAEISALSIGRLFLQEAIGGGLLGLVAGYLAYRLMLSIDDYKVEVMISLALVMGTYALSFPLHVSGPIAMVAAGMLIGNRGRRFAMSEQVADYLEKFWELIDEILNSVLFLLIGVEVLMVAFAAQRVTAGLVAIVIVLAARLVSVWVPITLLRRRAGFTPAVVRILTWAGLRGGISVALALSLPPIPEKSLILTCTYVVVLFSILVQGATIRRVLMRLLPGPGAAAES